VSLEITLDTKPFQSALDRIVRESLPLAVDKGLTQWGEETMAQAKENVPVMDGPLRASGVVLPITRLGDVHTLRMGFGGNAVKYAARVHENPRAGKTDGWGPKGPQEISFRVIKGKVRPIGARRKRWAKVGQFKFLEAPMAQRGPRLPETISRHAEAMR